eukprot:Gb_17230 [translate_table: standard]
MEKLMDLKSMQKSGQGKLPTGPANAASACCSYGILSKHIWTLESVWSAPLRMPRPLWEFAPCACKGELLPKWLQKGKRHLSIKEMEDGFRHLPCQHTAGEEEAKWELGITSEQRYNKKLTKEATQMKVGQSSIFSNRNLLTSSSLKGGTKLRNK